MHTKELEYRQSESVRLAIAREIARSVRITDEVIMAKIAMDEAISAYRAAIHDCVSQSTEAFR